MLQQEGHDVETTADEKLTGRSDVEVAAAARQRGTDIFTLDLSLQICGNIHLKVILESFCFR